MDSLLMEPCVCQDETFFTLLRNAAHWEFEIFLMLLFDGIVGAIALPFIKRYWQKHLKEEEEKHK